MGLETSGGKNVGQAEQAEPVRRPTHAETLLRLAARGEQPDEKRGGYTSGATPLFKLVPPQTGVKGVKIPEQDDGVSDKSQGGPPPSK
jgi:hypothetical protein